MSTTIDQRVVEMRFDNKHFENNARQSMTTLEKLKQKLNLKGAYKGLEDINRSANKVNMSGLSNALDTVHSRFSALEIMGVTALANITNSAVNAGKRIVSALTIDPVKSGFQEYETQIGAIQTILANTQKEGTNVEIVNKALDELNEYADQTIYNFTEMTRNIGTFTAAGVKLDDSVAAIKGIANLAAVSGSTSQQASTAMYQLSQALAAGKVQLMDWNSVVNAGMGGQLFQDALVRTSELLGTGAKKAIKTYGSFRESLTKSGWLTTEVLNETLKQLAGTYDKADLLAQGFTEKQAEEIVKLAETAKSAATEVKTFTQLWDVVKESAQSGWAQTWRIIVGDFEQAKALFSPLAKFLTGIIDKFSTARNKLLSGALSFNPFTALLDKLENSSIGKVVKKVDGISKSLEYYQDMVNKVWRGDYKNQPVRQGLMEAEGHNYKVIQSLVNKGYQYKLTVDDVREAEKKYGITVTETTQALENLSDTQLKEIGLTDEEIKMYRELEKQSKKTGKSIQEIVSEMEKKDGRTLLLESFANVGKGLVKVFKAIGEAWRDAFPPMTSLQLYNIIANLHSFSEKLVMSKDTANDLTRTLKGVFAILDLITMVVGGGFKIAFTILKAVLGAFNLDILEFTAILGDAIVKFRDWIEEHNLLAIVVTKSVKFLIKMGKAIVDLAKRLWNLPAVQKFIEPIADALSKIDDITLKDVISTLKSFGKAIKNAFSNINKHFNGVPGDMLSGLANGLKNGATKVITAIIDLAKKIIQKFKDILGIHSPSTVFFAIGGFIIAGLIGGLLSGSTELGSTVGGIVDKIKGFFGNVDWEKIFTTGISVGLLVVAGKIASAIFNVSKMFGGLGSIFDSVGGILDDSSKNIKKILGNTAKVVKNFSKVLGAIAFKKTTEGIKNLGITLLMLVGAIVILTLIDQDKMWKAVGVVAALAGILAGLALAVGLMSKASMTISKDGVQMSGLQSILVGIGAALLMMGIVIKMMGGMNPEEYKRGAEALIKMAIVLGVLVAALTILAGITCKGDTAKNIHKVGKMATKIAFALLLMVGVVKLASKLDDTQLLQASKFVGGFAVLMIALGVAAAIGGSDGLSKLGGVMLKMSITLLLMIGIVKLASKLENDELEQAGKFAAGFGVFMLLLAGAARLGGKAIGEIGKTVLAISVSMLLLVGAIKLLGGMDKKVMKRGTEAVLKLSALIVGLMLAAALFGSSHKLAGTLLSIAGAIGVLALITILLGSIDKECLEQGLKAVMVLGVIMAVLIGVSYLAKDVKGTLIGISIAIGVMTAAITVLSFIKPEKLVAPTLAISALMFMFALILKSSKNITGSMGCLIVMTAAIAIIAVALGLIALLPWQNTLAAALGLTLLMGTLAGLMYLMGKMKPSVGSALRGAIGLLALCVPLLALALALRLMKGVNNAIKSVIALTLLMGVMTGLMVIMSKISGAVAGAITGAICLLALCVPLVALAGILYLMRGIDNAIASATALSTLLVVMTGVLVALSVVGAMGPAAFIGMGALAALIVGLGALITGIGALVTKFPALEEFLNNGIPILEKIGYALGSFFGNIIGGALSGITSGLPDIGTDLSKFMDNLQPFINGAKSIDKAAMDGVKSLAETVLILTAANILDGISKLLGADNSLADFGDELSDFGESLKEFEAATKDVDAEHVKNAAEATKALVEIADAVPNSGGLLGKITGENDLSDFGDEINAFADDLVDFSEDISGLDSTDIDNIKKSAEATQELVKIADAVPNSGGLVAMITGDNSLDNFGDEIALFGKDLSRYNTSIQGIDPELIKKSATSTKELINMAKAFDPGLVEKVAGNCELSDFASGLVDFGVNLKLYGDQMVGLNTSSIETSIGAAKGLIELANALPLEGDSLWTRITGTKDLASFAEDLVPFGKNLKEYGFTVVGINTESIATSIGAADGLVRIAAVLNKSQGFGDITDGFITFVNSLPTFGTNLKIYSLVVSGLNVEAINTSVEATRGIVKIAKTLPSDGGIFSIFTGKQNLAEFALQLIPFGKGIKSYGNAVAGANIEAIENSVSAAKALVTVAKSIPAEDGFFKSLFGKKKDVDFASKLVPLAESMKKYANKAAKIDVDAIVESESAFKAIIRIVKNLSKLDTSNFGSINDTINSLNGINLNGLAKSFSSASGKFKNVGSDIMNNLVNGFKSKQANAVSMVNNIFKKMMSTIISFRGRFKNVGSLLMQFIAIGMKTATSKIASAIKGSLSAATTTIRGNYSGFYSAGTYVVSGFANGITANAYKAEAASRIMAQKALDAAKAKLRVKSPSREFYEIGDFAGQGFVNALLDNVSNSYNASYSMADSARKGLSKAISRIADSINSDMDMQPTIRPVLDLTDIENGTNRLSTMFNNGPSVGVMTNLSAISSGMNSMSQNGVNNDVVSAINDLRKDLGNVGGNTYNVNGITYDDGSNITDAVKTLVRAAKVERRI